MENVQVLQGENFEEAEMGQIAALQHNMDTVAKLRAEMDVPGLSHCEECGEEIPEERRKAYPSARLCIYHQEYKERFGSLVGSK